MAMDLIVVISLAPPPVFEDRSEDLGGENDAALARDSGRASPDPEELNHERGRLFGLEGACGLEDRAALDAELPKTHELEPRPLDVPVPAACGVDGREEFGPVLSILGVDYMRDKNQ